MTHLVSFSSKKFQKEAEILLTSYGKMNQRFLRSLLPPFVQQFSRLELMFICSATWTNSSFQRNRQENIKNTSTFAMLTLNMHIFRLRLLSYIPQKLCIVPKVRFNSHSILMSSKTRCPRDIPSSKIRSCPSIISRSHYWTMNRGTSVD